MNDNPMPEIDVSELINAVLGPQAVQILPGVTLFTKDGQTIGNAIVVKLTQAEEPTARDYLAKTDQDLWLIETDFGNRAKLSTREIYEMFELGRVSDYDKWWENRMEIIKKNIEESRNGTT